ncbi:hypothetical protein M514_05464 [Trichuris suis]|uniref:Uncharacterized protein n=1 Tax=Trichuris suis TaxID=68888 RepID=A0A085NJN3_9BILA|nr:hypothetical protein M513_05464 [Trichuris suis]KFD69679.1 hypothetical protein M514_05464 [Trichuris suis]
MPSTVRLAIVGAHFIDTNDRSLSYNCPLLLAQVDFRSLRKSASDEQTWALPVLELGSTPQRRLSGRKSTLSEMHSLGNRGVNKQRPAEGALLSATRIFRKNLILLRGTHHLALSTGWLGSPPVQ